jgi:hypothetical protein
MSAAAARGGLAQLYFDEQRLRRAIELTIRRQGSQGPLSAKLRRHHEKLATGPRDDPAAPSPTVPDDLAPLVDNPTGQAAEQWRIDEKRQRLVLALVRADKDALFTMPVVRDTYERARSTAHLDFLVTFSIALATWPDARIRRRAYLRDTQRILEAQLRNTRFHRAVLPLRRAATAAALRGDVAEQQRLDFDAWVTNVAPLLLPPRRLRQLTVAVLKTVAKKRGTVPSARQLSALRRRLARACPENNPAG